jgi:methylated-DNA-[protein]-cysteine S-methyltransferase
VDSFVVDSFVVDSPIGALGVAVTHDAVCGVSFGATVPDYRVESRSDSRLESRADYRLESQAESLPGPMVGHGVLDRARRQLDEYFAGQRTEFDLPLVVRRGSEFERAVWEQIAAIPYGETLSYGAIARAIGEPGGAQAVGMACNRNPLPLVVPCHRVIGSDGKLVGFGGGLDRKRFLLQLEARVHVERTFTAGLS